MKNLSFTLRRELLLIVLACLGMTLSAQPIKIAIDSRQDPTLDTSSFSNLEKVLADNGYNTSDKLAAITDLKITTSGKYTSGAKQFGIAIEPNDFTFLNTKLPALSILDLSEASVTNAINRDPTNSIPSNAFQNNKSIKTIQLPSTLVGIGTNAFINTALEGIIKIPKGVNGAANVDYARFGYSLGIIGFEADPESTYITTLDGVVFSKDMKELHFYPCGKKNTDYTMPEGVVTIRNSAFEHNYQLRNLTFASTVTTMQAGVNRFDVISNQSEIENVYVAPGSTTFGSANGVLYQLEGNRVVWSPRGKKKVIISSPIQRIAGGGSQNTIFGGNGSNASTGTNISNNYTKVITLLDLPSTLEEIENGAFVSADSLATIICRATKVPTIGQVSLRSIGAALKPQWSPNVFVPASSLESYKTSAWAGLKIGDIQYSGFNANLFKAFYNITLTAATAQSTIANDIAPESDVVTITANEAPAGMKFDKWTSTTEGVVFADAASLTTTFTMPAKDVEITATYKGTDGMENTGTTKDAVFVGKWNEATFNAFILANAANLTTIDLTGVTELTQVPVTANLNPNCLIYVNSGVIGNIDQNIISFDGSAYTGNVTLAEATDAVRNNSFNNKHTFTGNISYTRNFSNAQGKFATICLPFVPTNPSELTGLEFEEFDKVTVDAEQANLNFNTIEANALQANTPYIVKIAPETTTVTFKGASVTETNLANPPASEGYTFNGNYCYNNAVTSYYLIRADGSEFAKGSDTSYITAFRAYLTTTGSDNRKLTVGYNGGATGLEAQQINGLNIYSEDGIIYINAGNAQVINIYSLDGRIVKTTQLNTGNNTITGLAKGIYLINQQKVANK